MLDRLITDGSWVLLGGAGWINVSKVRERCGHRIHQYLDICVDCGLPYEAIADAPFRCLEQPHDGEGES